MIRTLYAQAIGLLSFLFLFPGQSLFAQLDTVPPVVACASSQVQIEFLPTGTYPLFVSDFLISVSDNTTPTSDIETAICVACDTFPIVGGLPQDNMNLICIHTGYLPIITWARDLSGNVSRCTTYANITSGPVDCFNQPVGGLIQYAYSAISNDPVPPCVDTLAIRISSVSILKDTFEFDFTWTLLPGGRFLWQGIVPGSSIFSFIRPISGFGTLAGVDLLDALKIQRHILGLEVLNSPYRLLAADVNGSRSITSSDVVEIKKRVLGATDAFSVPAFQYVQTKYQFPNPNNPFIPTPHDTIHGWGAVDRDFLMFKSGDVTGNGCTMFSGGIDDRNGSTHCSFDDQFVKAGNVVQCKMHLDRQFDALQLRLNHPGLQLRHSSLSYNTDPQSTAVIALLDEVNQVEFEFYAEQDGWLSDLLHLAGESNVAIDKQDQVYSLQFSPKKQPHSALAISPNPFSHAATVQFYLPEAQNITLAIHDLMGKTIYGQELDLYAGDQRLPIAPELLPAPGIYTLHLRLEDGSESMIKFMHQSH